MDADTLRAIIEESGLSQREFGALVCGVRARTIRDWLAGEPIPPAQAERLARLGTVQVTASDIITTVAR